MLGKLLGFIGLNPYVLAALGLLIVGMSGAIGWYAWDASAERAKAVAAIAEAARVRVERDTALAINRQKDLEIARLTRQAEINNDIMADLHQSMLELNASVAKQQADLEAAERDDPTLTDWLNLPLPDSYKRLPN
jgi:hypothetical protein